MSERKPDSERVNRNKRVFPTTAIIWDGQTRGPELPEGSWSRETREWWNWLRNSAQAMLMHDSDWLIMKVAATLHNQMYTPKKQMNKLGEIEEVPCTPGELKSLASEFRTYTDPYGMTRQSRIRYGINIVTPEDLENEATQQLVKGAQEVHAPVDYRKMFTEE
jgi:hypothetical protein